MKKILNLIIIALMLFTFTGCSNNTENVDKNVNSAVKTSSTTNNSVKKEENTTTKEEKSNKVVNYKEAAEKQMAMPEEGETIAIFHVKKFGDIKVKFFKDVAPKAVENFVTHAKNGYYNGLTFHRVINEFMIQGGDPEGTGMGGESIWGEGFGPELAYELVPYRGSLCMAMSSLPNSIGSQFFITQSNYDEQIGKGMLNGGWPQDLVEQYKKYGGNLHSLYYQYTVFGQVYEGMDVVDKIAAVKTGTVENEVDGQPHFQEDKPLEDVIIETIEVMEYKGK